MFGLIPLVGYLLIMKKNLFKKIFVILLFSFIIFNIYNIEPNFAAGNTHLDDTIAGEKEYTIAKTIEFSSTYYGYTGIVSAIFDIQGIPPEYYGSYVKPIASGGNYTVAESINKITDLRNSSKIVVIPEKILLQDFEKIQTKSKGVYNRTKMLLSYKNNININKICDLTTIYVLKGSG
jgi:hypothetical protein